MPRPASKTARALVDRAARAAADIWAVVKFATSAVISPVGVLFVAWRAARNYALAKERIPEFPAQIAALDSRLGLPAPNNRVRRLPDHIPMFISSDLHRCFPGRRDVCEHQDVKRLYAAVLDHYADAGWDVVENGDVEDYWMVGGSPYGQWYDAARVLGRLVPGRAGLGLRRALFRRHLRLIMENNVGVAVRIARLGRAGRYHRTVGNHDDVYLDRTLAANLAARCGGSEPVDFIVLYEPDGSASAVITHGHQTDGWNAAGRSGLGRLATWVGNTISDVPGLESPDSMLPLSATLDLLEGRLPNRLLQVNTRFGTNTKYDSVDEELLFDAFGGAAAAGPWLLMGHTHLPVLQPMSRTGVPWRRYANSGNGTWAGMVTGVEWTGGADPHPVVVAWLWTDLPGVADLIPAGAISITLGDRQVARVVMRRSASGTKLEIDPSATEQWPPAPTAAGTTPAAAAAAAAR